MSDAGGDIIIKGGSVQVHFDGSLYVQDSSDPRKHSSAKKKIQRIKIVDDTGRMLYDSGEHPDGLRWTVQVLCK